MERLERAVKLAGLLRKLPAKVRYKCKWLNVEVDKGCVRFTSHYITKFEFRSSDTLSAIEKALAWIKATLVEDELKSDK